MYRNELQRSPNNLLQACRAFLPDFAGLSNQEAHAIKTVIEISDALRLAAPGPMPLISQVAT